MALILRGSILLVASISVVAAAAPKPQSALSADEIAKRSHLVVYYPGKDSVGEQEMTIIEKNGQTRVREMSGMRFDVETGGDQWFYIYFRKPADVAGTCFMVHKRTKGDDDRWIYLPAVDLVRPIVANDKTQSFVGSDFTYEDVSGRYWTLDSHKLLGEKVYQGKPVWGLESIPKVPYPGYDRKISYVDKDTFMVLREELYQAGKLIRVGLVEKVDNIQGHPIPTRYSMEDVVKERKTVIDIHGLKLDVGLTADLFTERYLKAPPRQWIK